VLSSSTIFFCTGGGEFLYRFQSEKRQTLGRGHTQGIASLRAGGTDALWAFNNLTVLDDGVVDYIYGNQGLDWFWAFGNDKTDQKGNEYNR
jgi:hypothetical protein